MRTIVGSALIAALWAAAPAPVEADPTTVTAGSLVVIGAAGSGGTVMLEGTQGFTFNGTTGSGVFMPGLTCFNPVCTAGSTVDLRAHWVGIDLTGTATLDGMTYTNVGSLLGGTAQMDAEWSGTVVIPEGFTGGELSAPFLFSGVFRYPTGPLGELTPISLLGSGTAFLQFSPFAAFPGAFSLDSARYEFGEAPVPEPSTLMLVALGAAGLVRARSRRRREALSPVP